MARQIFENAEYLGDSDRVRTRLPWQEKYEPFPATIFTIIEDFYFIIHLSLSHGMRTPIQVGYNDI